MSDFKAGDRVKWWEDFKETNETPRYLSGVIRRTYSGGDEPWAVIDCDEDGDLAGIWARDYDKLFRADTTAFVAAFQARELPEDVREGAISSLRWACEPTDYDMVMAAGDLSGAEEYLPPELLGGL